MSGEALVSFAGNACGDAELHYTKQGVAVAGWTVAVTPRTKRGDDFVDGETAFYRCSAWKQRAEPCAESITKGMRLAVTGRLTTRTFETSSGEKRLSLEVDVDSVGPDLLFATASVQRLSRDGGNSGGRQGGGAPTDDPWGSTSGPVSDDEQPPF